MKILSTTQAILCAVLWFYSAQGQTGPGPEVGHGIDRTYDDGFIWVDSSGNAGGSTWYWGYDHSSQNLGGFLQFHYQLSPTELLTDTYDLGGIMAPLAPYSGTFEGPGPVIPDQPIFRRIEVVPEPSGFLLLLMGIFFAVKRT